MRCPNCGSYIEDDSIFCAVCGKKIIKPEPVYQPKRGSNYCPFCGTANDDDAVFCTGCGRDLIDLDSPYDDGGGADEPESHLVRNLIIALIAVLVLGLAGVGAYVWISSQNEEEQEDEEDSEDTTEEDEEDSEEPPTDTADDTEVPEPSTDVEEEPVPSSPPVLTPEPQPVPEVVPEVQVSEYIIPDSSTRRLTAADLAGLTAQQLNYARNEIFARHGRQFSSPELQTYFNSKSWYNGIYSPDYFDTYDPNPLSDIEKANTQILREYEDSLGGYQLDQ